MLNIKSILERLLHEITSKTGRVEVKDWERILDTKTGVELHIFDNSLRAMHDGNEIIRSDGLTEQEKDVVWQIKEVIAGPEKMMRRAEEYPSVIAAQREAFADHFENPQPIFDGVIEEQGTEEYKG